MKKEMVLYVGIIVMCALFLGCATMPSSLKEEVPAVRAKAPAEPAEVKEATDTEKIGAKIDGLINEIRKLVKLAEAAPAPSKKEEAAPLLAKPEAAAPATPAVSPVTEEAISDLQKRMKTQEAKTSSLGTDVGLLKREVAGIRVRVVRVNKDVGTALELSGKEGERYFSIGPFYEGKAKLTPEGKEELKALLLIIKEEGLVAKEIKAFADITRAKTAKTEAEGKKMNEALSAQRGEVIKKALGDLAKDAKVVPRGETGKFGDLAANRRAMVVLVPAPLPPPK